MHDLRLELGWMRAGFQEFVDKWELHGKTDSEKQLMWEAWMNATWKAVDFKPEVSQEQGGN